jgi:hypothetical protein
MMTYAACRESPNLVCCEKSASSEREMRFCWLSKETAPKIVELQDQGLTFKPQSKEDEQNRSLGVPHVLGKGLELRTELQEFER